MAPDDCLALLFDIFDIFTHCKIISEVVKYFPILSNIERYCPILKDIVGTCQMFSVSLKLPNIFIGIIARGWLYIIIGCQIWDNRKHSILIDIV